MEYDGFLSFLVFYVGVCYNVIKGRGNMNYTYNQQEMRNRAFCFIYDCAMHDAILQRAFNGEKTWVGKVDSAKTILSEYVCKVLNNEFPTQLEHDSCFLQTANSICKEINSRKPTDIETDIFSFGNAQKLINITIKHIYTFCYQMPSLRDGFRFCHCPVDAIMLQKVWKLCKGNIDLGKQQELCKSWGSEGSIENEQPELQDFPERYDLFQKTIRKLIDCGDIFPIEFDYVEWKN